MSIGARLAELRLRTGKSLQDVADVVGVSKTHVWQMEKGKSENPSIELLRRFADYFSVPVEFLIGTESTSIEDVEAQQFSAISNHCLKMSVKFLSKHSIFLRANE